MAATKNKSTRPPPASSRQASSGSVKKAAAVAKTKQKPNGNIMSFFKKEEAGLFIAENGGPVVTSSRYFEKDVIAEDDSDRYNELETPSKRRRLSEETDAPQDEDRSLFGDEEPVDSAEPATAPAATKSGPFMNNPKQSLVLTVAPATCL
jgi:hypothetical protein